MSKVDGFLVTIIILIAGFFVVYKTSEFQYSGVQFEKEKNKILVHQIQQLKLKENADAIARLEKMDSGPQRSIASITAAGSKKPSRIDANKELIDSAAVAEAYYQTAKINCEKYKKEDVCTKNIEIIVSQFPETRWAGESLLLLSRLYMKTRHLERAREILNIVRTEFKYDKEIQSKLAAIESSRK